MRVVTWNLWWRFGPWEQRQAAIVDVLTDLDPDVVCLQEVWSEEGGADQVQQLADALELHAVRTPEHFYNGVSFGNAILSRHPISAHESHRLPPLEGPGRRYALAAEIEGPAGRLPVISTHLDHRFDHSAVRQEQIDAVLHVAAGMQDTENHPVGLAGDLNAVPTSDEVRLITGERPPPVPGLVMSDAWAQRGDGPGLTWSSTNPYVVDSA
ncbi:MAG: endonuclease/exonuclease/phosphatase family protein, partial [Actinomycetota bacterium]|nr:endonuclease/exonuclease/phosphatase family protein [Actinomycetota bacterium]